MGILKKIKGIMDPYDNDNYDNNDNDSGEYTEAPYEETFDYSPPAGGNYSQQQYSPNASYSQGGGNYAQQQNNYAPNQQSYQQAQQNRSSAVTATGAPLSLKLVKPEKYENCTEIASHLLNHNTVVLNLEDTNREACRRILDFLSGVAFSIDGKIKKVSNLTYVITPNNVDFVPDQARDDTRNNNSF